MSTSPDAIRSLSESMVQDRCLSCGRSFDDRETVRPIHHGSKWLGFEHSPACPPFETRLESISRARPIRRELTLYFRGERHPYSVIAESCEEALAILGRKASELVSVKPSSEAA